MTTKVKCTCTSKRQYRNYDPANPLGYEIELSIPYDQKSIYFQLSGGTSVKLCTINQAAADMFEVGGEFDIVISRSEPE